jgi:hypothetical protein
MYKQINKDIPKMYIEKLAWVGEFKQANSVDEEHHGIENICINVGVNPESQTKADSTLMEKIGLVFIDNQWLLYRRAGGQASIELEVSTTDCLINRNTVLPYGS